MLGSGKAGALGTASGRFLDGLPRKAAELASAVAQVSETPGAERAVEELRRRLHALYASAQVFHLGPLATALKDALSRIDSARDRGAVIGPDDLAALRKLAGTLPDIGRAQVPDWDSATPMRPVIALGNDGVPSTSKTPSSVPPPPASARDSVPPPAPTSGAPASARPARGDHTTLQGLQKQGAAADAARASSPPARSSLTPGLEEAVRAAVARVSEPPAAVATSASSATNEAPPAVAVVIPSPAAQPLPTAVSLAVIGGAIAAEQVKGAASAGAYQVVHAAGVHDGLRVVQESSPDMVIVAHDLGEVIIERIVASLRRDPLTDFVPVVVLFTSESAVDRALMARVSADAALPMPVTAASLGALVSRISGLATEPGMPSGSFGEMTPSELADRLAGELRRGLVDTAEHGRDQKVSLDDGTEVMAAAWSAIARIRSHVSQRAGGKVSFRDEAGLGGPRHLAVTFEGTPRAGSDDVSLAGRRFIVADDDEGIRAFFAGLLRSEGATVVESEDGAQALTSARRERPDLIISDILMPRLDGFALCRALAAEPMLMDVPVILLSWKEDLLVRMRELASGASGYLRKESGSAVILEQVRDALRPRVRVERELATDHDVHGRVEGVGVGTLLRSVANTRGYARVTLRDAVTTYEVTLQDRSLVDARELRGDAEVARGDVVLPKLTSLGSARFVVSPITGSVKETVRGGDAMFGLGKAQVSVPAAEKQSQKAAATPASDLSIVAMLPTSASASPKSNESSDTTPAAPAARRMEVAPLTLVQGTGAKPANTSFTRSDADLPLPTGELPSLPPIKHEFVEAARAKSDLAPRVGVGDDTSSGLAWMWWIPVCAALGFGVMWFFPRLTASSRKPVATTSVEEAAKAPTTFEQSVPWKSADPKEAEEVAEPAPADPKTTASTSAPAAPPPLSTTAVGAAPVAAMPAATGDSDTPGTAPETKPVPKVAEAPRGPFDTAMRRLGGDLTPADAAAGLGERDGKIVIRSTASSQSTFVRVDDRDLGAPPISAQLSEGRHRFVFLAPDGEHYRFWFVARGQVRTVDAP